MTLDSVLQQWASSISTDAGTGTRSLPAGTDAAKLPTMKGYLKCELTDVTSTTATYPFKVKMVSADGSAYPIDLSTDDPVGSGSGTSTTSETSLAHIPVNNTLFKYLLSSDWIVGSATDFEATREGNVVW